jgi:hypothetical protein
MREREGRLPEPLAPYTLAHCWRGQPCGRTDAGRSNDDHHNGRLDRRLDRPVLQVDVVLALLLLEGPVRMALHRLGA